MFDYFSTVLLYSVQLTIKKFLRDGNSYFTDSIHVSLTPWALFGGNLKAVF